MRSSSVADDGEFLLLCYHRDLQKRAEVYSLSMPSCRSCSAQFELLPGEAALHEKITSTFETGPMDPPGDCPDCRLQRKMAWRNERHLYHRKCDKTAKIILSVYPEKTPFPVYERAAWWKDDWDALEFGRSCDFTRTFFEQFQELLNVVPRSALNSVNVENCDYCNFAFDARNCYLAHLCYRSEGMLFCYWMLDCKDDVDCSFCLKTERCYDCTDCNHSYGCHSCVLSHTCSDCSFLYDCRACTECFGCVGLRRKTHCMFNEQLTKEEYNKRLTEMDLQNPTHVKAVRDRVLELRKSHPHLYSIQDKTENCSGDYIFESKDCHRSYQIYRSQDCMYIQDCETKDALHDYHIGWSELTYESYSSVRQRSTAFCIQCWDGHDMFYSDNCQSCSHCFGCVRLRHKQYCILNKQYSKEEYLKLLPKIVAMMKQSDEWGRFFPISMSPFAYNETMAQQDYPLTESEVKKRGWRWTKESMATTGKETLKDVPQRIQDVPESITKEVLGCTACKRNYKIIPQELALYRQMSIPLPGICPECRYGERLKNRNPRKLWKRTCGKCGEELETTFSPERSEVIYCETCYLKTVY